MREMTANQSLFQRTVSRGGLRIVSEKMPNVRSACVGICIHTGSMFETDPEAGISHMLEHMVFKGTANRSGLAIVQEIEGVGGHINAYTSKEITCFHAHMLDQHLGLALDILCDLLISPILSAEDLEREKQVIIEEIRHYEDSPDDLVFDYFYQTVYGDHALARPIMGTVETVSSLTREQLQRYLQESYPLGRTVVAAAGNLDHNDLVAEIEKRLGLADGPGSSHPSAPSLPPPHEERYPRSVQGAHICRGVPGLAYDDPRKFAGFILSNILGGGMSSRLFQRIREVEALAYSVFSFQDSMRDSGIFGTYLGTDPSRLDQVLGVLDEEFRRILSEGLPEDEVLRAKEQIKGNLMLGLESTSARMFRLAKLEQYLGEFVTLDETLALIDAVGVADVMALAHEFLDPDRQYTTIVLPKDGQAAVMAEASEEDEE
ncbi:MAG: insulinase family protein [Candidatus Zixiibacteriota bacterium]|nr:MAG: insulinase family protein [candidate division Zixibacteria bacterium]